MSGSGFATGLSAAFALAILLLAPSAFAQDGYIGGVDTGAKDSFAIGALAEYNRNLDTALSDAARETGRERATRLKDEEAAGRAVAAESGVTCEVSEAILLGKTDDDVEVYEAACATGPGYLVTASTPPVAVGCVVANTAAAHAIATNPTVRPPAACTLPANLNVDAAIADYAREAGIGCTVDEVRAIGQVGSRAIYEIGCAGRDGYRITPSETGWDKVACLVVVNAGSTCAFTTPAEQLASLHALLADTPAADCVVDGGRYMGASANGTYYEARCAGADGYIFRVRDDATEVFACADAEGIGGGCILTAEVPSAAPPGN
ncbi:MAG: hypothetical protein KKA16_13550 [Alphaproteobacteria bacterium]|nr:hypothetical protein [Alphaproteobacteria bacterium]MBU2380630.1 hypothetical protein [Alphaproteobacteria bacterium]